MKLTDFVSHLLEGEKLPDQQGQIVYTWLIGSFLTEIHDDISCPSIECVEVGPVLSVQTLDREVVNASQSLHQFTAMKNIQGFSQQIKRLGSYIVLF